MNATNIEELYSLLVPLANERLLVPRACVAEVVTWQEPEEMANAPLWYLGTTRWNGRSIPVVSFEALCGEPIPAAGGRTRIVVFVAISGKLESGYFGLMSQGFPQLVRVSPDIVKPDPARPAERMPALCQVHMVNESPFIPDFERIEQMIGEETSA
jgi:chemosensory pili system protein ChpC